MNAEKLNTVYVENMYINPLWRQVLKSIQYDTQIMLKQMNK